MRKIIVAVAMLPLLGGLAFAKGPGGSGGGGSASHGGSGPSNGAPDSVGPLADTDWRVQWVLQRDRAWDLQHNQQAPVAGSAVQQPAQGG